MRFARLVFRVAGIWGLLIVTPLYFMYDTSGHRYPPPVTHPDFYYGFIGVTLVWQIAFLIVSTDPARYRPLMIAAVLEKFSYMATMTTLLAMGRIQFGQFAVVSPDAILCVLFLVSFLKTRPAAGVTRRSAVSA